MIKFITRWIIRRERIYIRDIKKLFDIPTWYADSLCHSALKKGTIIKFTDDSGETYYKIK